jgi:hypothetical protein
MDEEFDKQDRELRLRQERCIHPSWKCTCCQLHKDHYKLEEHLYIKNLESKITEYESILTSLGFCFKKCDRCSEDGIIKFNTAHFSMTVSLDEPKDFLVEERL